MKKILYILLALQLLELAAITYALFYNPSQSQIQSDEKIVEDAVFLDGGKTVENLQVVIPLCTDGKPCTYSGQIDSIGVPDGEGTAWFDNGDRLEGTFKHGNVEGEHCKYYFKHGDIFVGSMQNNEFVKGRHYLPDGSYFEGSFSDNRPKDGTWYDKNGKIIEEPKE